MISLFLELTPTPAARPRVYRGHAHTPEPYASWKRHAAAFFRSATAGQTLAPGPLWLQVDVYHPRPKSRPKHVTIAEWKAGGLVMAITRSDLDNHVKAISDALQDSGLLDNDNRIAQIAATSWYAPEAGRVGCDVNIGAFADEPIP